MGMNYELERHIEAARTSGNTRGVEFLHAQKVAFNAAREAGIVEELPLEAVETKKETGPNQINIEPTLSIEQDGGRFVLSVSLVPEDYRKIPTCQNCGREYRILQRFSRVESKEDQVELEISDPHGGYKNSESIFLSREGLKKKGVELADPMFPFANPEVFQMVFGHENPDIVYRRLRLFLLNRFIHARIQEEDCEQYVRQGPPSSMASFLFPIFETMRKSGFSLREISKAFSRSSDWHTTVRRHLKAEQSSTKPVTLPINPRKSKFKWNGIQLSADGRVVSELEIGV